MRSTVVRFVAERANLARKLPEEELAAHKAAIAFHASGLGWAPAFCTTRTGPPWRRPPLHTHLSGL